ncbi:MAG TPA: hypothetical protein VF587_04490 [Solirubrobacteraceae bacterium]|jgi:hypothetical protein
MVALALGGIVAVVAVALVLWRVVASDGEEHAPSRRGPTATAILNRLGHALKLMFYAVAGADNERSMRDYHQASTNPATVDRINKRRFELAQERAGLRLWRTLITIGCGSLPFVFFVSVPEWEGDTITSLRWVLGASLVFTELFLLVTLRVVRARVADLGAQLQSLEYELVLTSFEEGHEQTAANLFFKHQVEVKRYYDQTLRQNRMAFAVGMICISFGLAAIVAVAALVLRSPDSTSLAASIAAGGLGILSTLLTALVTRIFLRVYEGSGESLNRFHDRLVATHHYHFANLLIAMIDTPTDRMRALSKLAQAAAAPRVATKAED